MSHAHRRVSSIDRLAARALAAIHIHAHIVHVQVDIDFIHFGQHRHCHRAGVDAPLTFGFRHALDTMHAALVFKPAVRTLPAHLEHDIFEAAHAGFVLVNNIHFPALAFSVIAVQAEQIGNEQTSLVPTGPGANFHDDVFIVTRVFGQQQHLELFFQPFDAGLQFLNFLFGHLAQFGVAFVAQQGAGVFQLARLLFVNAIVFDNIFQPGALFGILHDFLIVAHHLRVADEAFKFSIPGFNTGQFIEHGCSSRTSFHCGNSCIIRLERRAE